MDQQRWFYLLAVTAATGPAQLLSLAFGFEAETGLPRASVALLFPPLVLVAGAVGALYLTRGMEKRTDAPVEMVFPFCNTLSVVAGVLGSFLLLGSAVLGFVQGEGRTPVVFAALMGACALYLAAALRRGQAEPMMTLPAAYLMPVLLLLRYRELSYNSAWACFYLEVLALAALVVSYALLAGFAFRQGKPRLYAVVAMLSVPLCFFAALQSATSAAALCFLGHAAVQVGFLATFIPEPQD